VDYSKLEDIFFKGTCDGYDVKGVNYRIWDDVAKVPYLGDALGRMYASYEDIESLNAKVEYAKSRNMLGVMIWEYRHDNDAGTLRHAVKHAMDGNPDAPGRYERPEENIDPDKPRDLPVMGKVTKFVLGEAGSGKDRVEELSGLCLSKDEDFLWGIHDKGTLFRINFDGTFQKQYYHEADFEGITIDPATGNLYVGLESSSKSAYKIAAPNYNTHESIGFVVEGAESMSMTQLLKSGLFWVFLILMVAAGASEATMAQWTSAFAEASLGVDKAIGDIAGPCGFAFCMGLGRLWYGKKGQNMDLSAYMMGAGVLCFASYLTASLAPLPIVAFVGCMVSGLAVGIMWPGSISLTSARMPEGGTAMFALLALGGDMGGTLGPSLVGICTGTSENNIQDGLLAASLFPVLLVVCLMAVRRKSRVYSS
jgi:hypothetical protein